MVMTVGWSEMCEARTVDVIAVIVCWSKLWELVDTYSNWM